jgi:processive 1,2-diacylglycerol beta-glucosyltransferase
MRVLILSVTAGEGHNSCAAALRQALENRGHQVRVADLYRSCGVPRWLTDRVYRTCAKEFRHTYSRTYSRLERDEAYRRELEHRFLPGWLYPKLQAWMKTQEADCVVAMHVFAARVLTLLRQRGAVPSIPILGVNTDYCLHPYWEDCPGLDGLVVPTEEMTGELLDRGIPKEAILPLGIPIREPDRFRLTQDEARRRLSLGPGKLVLLMGGSMGYGHIFSTALALKRRGIRTVCVCGRNRTLRAMLAPHRSEELQVLGFTRRLPEYMAAADLAVTKPGGLSLSELAAAGVPPLLTRPIPGHEERNLRLWTRLGAALSVEDCADGEEIAALAAEVLGDEDRLRGLRTALKALSRPEAAENLCTFVESLDKAPVYR